MGLRPGTPVCIKHTYLCGADVDARGHHPLICKHINSIHARHRAGNEAILRAFISANIPATLEPVGLCRADQRRPDGMTLLSWSRGKAVAWDFTCVIRLAQCYTTSALNPSSTVAERAENKKLSKYAELTASVIVQPVAFEHLGGIGPLTLHFLQNLGKGISQTNGDPNAGLYLRQRLAIGIQAGNVISDSLRLFIRLYPPCCFYSFDYYF